MNKLAIEWYDYLIDDCKSIIVETNHIIEWTRLEKYHELGKRILQDTDKAPHKELVQHVAQDLSLSTRTIYYAVQFAKQYPSLANLPEGKAISWRKMVNKYLPKKEARDKKGKALTRQVETPEECPELLSSKNKEGTQDDPKKLKNQSSPSSFHSFPPPESSSYTKYVKAHKCILCGKSPVDYAHWPRTRVRGKFGIPLCRACHRHQEDLPRGDFLEMYSEPIEGYLSELVQLIWRKEEK